MPRRPSPFFAVKAVIALALLCVVLFGLGAPRPASAGDVTFFVPGCPVELTAELPPPFLPVREATGLVERFNSNPGRQARYSLALAAAGLTMDDGQPASVLAGTSGAVMAAQGRVSFDNFAEIRDGLDANLRAPPQSDVARAARAISRDLERGIEERDGVEIDLLGSLHLDTLALSDTAVASIHYSALARDGRPMEGYAAMRLDYVDGCIVTTHWSLPPDLVLSAVRKLVTAFAIAAAR